MSRHAKLGLLALMIALSSGCVVNTAVVTPAPTQGSKPSPAGTTPATNADLVNKPVTNVMVSQDSLVIQAKKTQQVQATVTYADGSSDSNVNWSSNDNTIVAINPTTGLISAIKPGTATIQAKSASDPTKSAFIKVSVKEGEVEAVLATVTPASGSLAVGETLQLSAEVQTSNGKTNPNGSWSSSNSTVAVVSGAGLVTGKKKGTATITFTSDENATVKGSATITVTDPSAPAPTASGS